MVKIKYNKKKLSQIWLNFFYLFDVFLIMGGR